MPVSQVNMQVSTLILFALLFLSSINAETIYVFGNSSGNMSITTSSIPGSWTYGGEFQDLNIYFKTKLTSSDAVHFEVEHLDEDRSIDYQLQNANESTGIVSGNSITYPLVFNYTNITYRIISNHLVKIISISNESAPTNITFKIKRDDVDYRII